MKCNTCLPDMLFRHCLGNAIFEIMQKNYFCKDDCVYYGCIYVFLNRCRLKEKTLYFAFLLPMGVIVLFNTVIFILVSRVVFANKNAKLLRGNGK